MSPLARLARSGRRLAGEQPLAEMGWLRRGVAWPLRLVLWLARREVYDRLKLHAQALTYDTLLALVPSLAVIMAMVNGFGSIGPVATRLQGLLVENISGTPELRAAVATHLHDFVLHIQGGGLGALSVILLIFSTLSLLGHIELAFNVIFGATKRRPLLTRVAVYWAALTLGPILLGASIAARASLARLGADALVAQVGTVPTLVLEAVPWLTTYVAFATVYLVVPQAAVRPGAAIPAAVVAGSIWRLGQMVYGIYARNAFAVHDIYGSLAAVPLFILGVYVSWLLVLAGAQLAFVLQHRSITLEAPPGPVHAAAQELALCRIFFAVAEDFAHGRPACAREGLPARLGLPVHLTDDLVRHLCRQGFLQDAARGRTLLPGRELKRVSVADLLASLRHAGSAPRARAEAGGAFFAQMLQELDAEQMRRAGSIDFQALVARLSPRPPPPPLPSAPLPRLSTRRRR